MSKQNSLHKYFLKWKESINEEMEEEIIYHRKKVKPSRLAVGII
jgi:hypothetical protein